MQLRRQAGAGHPESFGTGRGCAGVSSICTWLCLSFIQCACTKACLSLHVRSSSSQPWSSSAPSDAASSNLGERWYMHADSPYNVQSKHLAEGASSLCTGVLRSAVCMSRARGRVARPWPCPRRAVQVPEHHQDCLSCAHAGLRRHVLQPAQVCSAAASAAIPVPVFRAEKSGCQPACSRCGAPLLSLA